jgi:histidinol-phosphatase
MNDYARELEAAVGAVEGAAKITLEYFRSPLEVETKADASPVTIADRRAEQHIRAELSRAFPQDGLLGEEFGEQKGSSGRRWIIDPIDGTQSFIRGVPLYGVLVGLEDAGRCVVGVSAFPGLGQTLWASRGGGAFMNGERASVSSVASLEASTLLSSDAKPESFGDKYPGFERLLSKVLRHRGWGDCYGYALVATGRAEIMLDPILNPWDSAAMVPILEEAGAVFFDWSGASSIYGGSGIATSAVLADAVRAELVRSTKT